MAIFLDSAQRRLKRVLLVLRNSSQYASVPIDSSVHLNCQDYYRTQIRSLMTDDNFDATIYI